MKSIFEKTVYWVGVLSLGLIVGISMKVASAWIEPTTIPPGNNILAPLNSSAFGQSKIGGLILNLGGAAHGLIVRHGLVGIGTDDPKEKIDVDGNIKLSGDVIMSNKTVTGLRVPSAGQDAVNKDYVNQYVDAAMSNLGGGNGGGPMYDNEIVDMTPPNAYTEVCFKNGNTSYDKHNGNESTSGGNCVPGDSGFIIEKSRRNASFIEAKTKCAQINMRLPESFEWQYSCEHRNDIEAPDIFSNGYEWASNVPGMHVIQYTRYFVGVPIMGNGTCWHSEYGLIAADNGGGYPWSNYYRCVR